MSGTPAAGVALLPLITTKTAAQETAPNETVLYIFTGGDDDSVSVGLVEDAFGNLYRAE